MRIRAATIDDVPELIRTLVLVAPEGTLGVEPPVDEPPRADGFRQRLAAAGTRGVTGDGAGWVLEEDDGTHLGYLELSPRPGGVLAVAMALRPAGRGRGGGRALIEQAITHARTRRVHKLDLEVWIDNARAIALYAQAGFVVEGLRRDHYRRRDGTLRSTLVMALRVR